MRFSKESLAVTHHVLFADIDWNVVTCLICPCGVLIYLQMSKVREGPGEFRFKGGGDDEGTAWKVLEGFCPWKGVW